jgi:hypothetical protein
MKIVQWLPPLVRELLKNVPALGLELTDWEGVRRDAPLMAARLISQSGVARLQEIQSGHFGSFLSFDPPRTKSDTPIPPAEFGNLILRYYFSQLEYGDGVFLDLRPDSFQQTPGKLHFRPNGFWYRFSDDFRLGLLDLYDGFYFNDEEKFEQGLKSTGLLSPDWPEVDRERVKRIFRSHFGDAREQPMRFTITDFQKNFLKIFEFLLEKKVKLSSEFMLFGVYLVTLYLALEKFGAEHEVGRIYREVRTASSFLRKATHLDHSNSS